MIKLYGISGSRALRSLWAIEEVGVDYEHVKTSFVGETRTPEFLAINPNGHIPVLQDGDLTIWESLAINLYLAEKYDGGLRPKSIEERALATQWSIWSMTEVEPPLMQVLMNKIFLPEDQRDPKEVEAGIEQLQAPLAVLDTALDGRQYLVGADFGIADLNAASVLSLVGFCGIDISDHPNVARWLAACTSRPAAQKVQSL